jgi:hypothetical protein
MISSDVQGSVVDLPVRFSYAAVFESVQKRGNGIRVSTIWVNYELRGKLDSDERNKDCLYRFSTQIARLSQAAGIRPITEFFDNTEAEARIYPDIRAPARPLRQRLLEDGKWFLPEEGIEALQALRSRLVEQPVRFGFLVNAYPRVLEEIDDCLRSLELGRSHRAKFHFGVIMSR